MSEREKSVLPPANLPAGVQLTQLAMAARDRLTEKQAQFAEYLVGEANWNRMEAARMVGTPRPMQASSEWWLNPKVKRYISELLAIRLRHRGRSVDATMELLVALAHSDVTDVMDLGPNGLEIRGERLSDLPWHVRQAIQSLDVVERKVRTGNDENGKPVYATERRVQVKFHNKMDAVRILAQANKIIDDQQGEGGDEWSGLTIIRSGEQQAGGQS